MSVDIFGQSADMDALMAIAKKYGLKVISDTAQAPGSFYKGKHTGMKKKGLSGMLCGQALLGCMKDQPPPGMY